jgi:hypothetical protein
MKRVIIESPYAGRTSIDRNYNLAYARALMLDSLRRGEAPFLSHLLYTQVLDDDVPEDRKLGIEAGFAWGKVAEETVVGTNLPISDGMKLGVERSIKDDRIVIERTLPGWSSPPSVSDTESHTHAFLSGEGLLSSDPQRAGYQVRSLARFVEAMIVKASSTRGAP